MATVITAGNATNGLKITPDNTGILELKTGTGAGTTALTLNDSQNATLAGTLQVAGVTTSLYPIVSGTAVTTTSGSTAGPFTVPSWAKRITVMFAGVRTAGAGNILVQLGDAGGIENTGYASSGGLYNGSNGTSLSSSTAGFIVICGSAALTSGQMIITNISGNLWSASHSCKFDTANVLSGGGDKTLSDTLTQVQVTLTASTFNAGTINILYE
jgi:hypothetical protein